MYESPIEIFYKDIANGIQIKMENDICKAICSYGININREELIKALAYDRDQYEKGYAEGHIDGMLKAEKLYARPIGTWIKEDDEHLKGWYRCSKCGRRVEDLTDDVIIHAGCEEYTIADIYPYCHCGAQMENKE